MKDLTHIVITGFMASGKTSVARTLARVLDRTMIDLDEVISRREERSIREIIEQDGEDHFRVLETSALGALLHGEGQTVVALGGGTWGLERNRKLIAHRRCTTVWLDTPFELCWQRIEAADPFERPLARTYAQALKLYQERRSDYQLAMIRIAADNLKNPKELALAIADHLHKNGGLPDQANVGLSL
ncbi:MAG TPA: shikimate kinase [Pyrinomonadaceae bacterium]|nr:shikimate kinase [Pyrinomonadaceae bacterium]